MHVTSACRLRVASLYWRPSLETYALTIVCKATFSLQPVRSPLAATQEEPLPVDVPWDDGFGSLKAARDFVPFKRLAEVLVTGHAYAPVGSPASSLTARVRACGVDKRIEVTADRWWTADDRLIAGSPFSRMPLRWERAAGGPGTWNPAGVPLNAAPDVHGLRPLPNLLPAGFAPRSPVEIIPPAGLGPIAPTWPERSKRLRMRAATFSHDGWQEHPLPQDIDVTYFNAAPPEQRVDQLLLREQIILNHLHPEHVQLVTVLDEVVPRARLERRGAAAEDVRLRCDTLCIDADRGTCTLTWRGAVPLRHPGEEGAVIVTMEGNTHAPVDVMSTLAPGMMGPRKAATVPFVRGSGVPPFGSSPPGPTAPEPVLASPTSRPAEEPRPERVAPPVEAHESAPAAPSRRLSPSDVLSTMAPGMVPGAALPFRPAAPDSTPFSRPEPEPPSLLRPVDSTPEPSYGPPRSYSLPASSPISEPPRPLDDVAPAPSKKDPPAPPPFWGPLAKAEPPKADLDASTQPPSPIDDDARAPAVEAPAADDPPAAALPLDAYPIERCAAIAAKMACQPELKRAVLEQEQLTFDGWQALHEHWLAALRAEAERWKKDLVTTYDAAYVAALEAVRGPIAMDDYARLVVATERGKTADLMHELSLPEGAATRIRRVWLAKLVKDAQLNALTQTAIQSARAR